MVGGGFAVLQQHRVAKTAQRIVKPCSSIARELELNWSSPTRVEFGIRVGHWRGTPSYRFASHQDKTGLVCSNQFPVLCTERIKTMMRD